MDMVNYGCHDLKFAADSSEITSRRQFGVFEARVEVTIPN